MARNDLQGTFDLLVLKTLSQTGELHGYGIVLHIQRASDELLGTEPKTRLQQVRGFRAPAIL
jgi:PadR family transcriptional regulator PadR